MYGNMCLWHHWVLYRFKWTGNGFDRFWVCLHVCLKESIKVVTDSGICIPTILVFVSRSITKTNKYLLCRNDDAVLRASAPLYYCLFLLWSNAIFVVFICNICTRNRRPNFHTYSPTAVNMFFFCIQFGLLFNFNINIHVVILLVILLHVILKLNLREEKKYPRTRV